MKQGILYLAINDINYIEYLDISIASLRKEGYAGNICVLTNFKHIEKKPDVEYKFLDIKKEEPIRASRRVKTQLNKFTPYDTTLYLDCDTIILNPIDKVWDFASDFAVSRDTHKTIGDLKPSDVRFRSDELDLTVEQIGKNAPYFSGSTVLWNKSEQSDAIYNAWHEEWKKFQYTDQMSLARAVTKNKFMLSDLPEVYNTPLTKYSGYKDAKEHGSVVYAVWGSKRDVYLEEYKQNELS